MALIKTHSLGSFDRISLPLRPLPHKPYKNKKIVLFENFKGWRLPLNLCHTSLRFMKFSMIASIFSFFLPELEAAHVKMKDKNLVLEKIKRIIDGGSKKLQIITDFDRTITKHYHNGVASMTSNNIFKMIPSLPEDFVKKTEALYHKYRPIEDDPHMSIEEKTPHMLEWYEVSFELFVGLPYNQEEVVRAVRDSKIALRTGADQAFKNLNESKIPVLVFSSGLGNVVSAVIEEYGLLYDNVKIISNFFRVENNKIAGLQDKILHIFNKNEHAIENTDYFKALKDRTNAIVMGDSLGDANMAEGLKNAGTILKIGFLSSNIDDFLPQYLDKFDIVLINDETMDLFNTILKKLL